MTLIIEDGTGVTGAETYFDRPFFDDFVTSWGLGDPTQYTDENEYEGAVRRGTLSFDSVYGIRFSGYPVKGTQGLRFPMTGLIDARSYSVPPLPVQVKQAAAALSWYELVTPMGMLPTVTPGKVKKMVKAGPVEVEYDVTDGSAGQVYGQRPVHSIVEAILAPLGGSGSTGRTYYGSAVRG